MKIQTHSIPLAILLAAVSPSLAAASFTTSFTGDEGYTSGTLGHSNQTGAAHFNASSSTGGLYLPSGQSPGYGTVKQNPTANNSIAWYKTGDGLAFATGGSWTSTLDFAFEGLAVSEAIGSAKFLGQTGFSTSSTTNTNTMFAGIQKTTGQAGTQNYQFFISGGGFASQNVSYSDLGDDAVDDNDLTDNLRMQIILVKSATLNQFDATASLINLNTSITVASVGGTLTMAGAYSSDLFGFLKSGSVADGENFDLFEAYDYSYAAVPEPAAYSILLGGVAFLSLLRRKRR